MYEEVLDIATEEEKQNFYWENKSPDQVIRRIDIAASLAILLAEINQGEYHNCIYTFSHQPKLMKLQGNTLAEKFKYLEESNKTTWGFQTNFRALFNDILLRAKQQEEKKEIKELENKKNIQEDIANIIPSRIVVLSDMEFSDLAIPDIYRRLRRERGKKVS